MKVSQVAMPSLLTVDYIYIYIYISPLSALLIRLAAVVDRNGRSSAEHRYIVCTVRRYFSGVAHRLWPVRR